MHEVAEDTLAVRSVTELVGLIKKGDRASLSLLRERLERSRAELAAHLAIPESRLAAWEENQESPSPGQQALWRVKLSDYLDVEIRTVLGTDNVELLACFWDLLWRLS